MEEYVSIGERRRRAPAHHLSRASATHAAAKYLAEGRFYNDSFRREAALALELVTKAVIAQRMELGLSPSHIVRVRPTHDLPELWKDAGLPELSREDQHRLMIATSILYWSGRYAAPKTDDVYDKEREREKGFENVVGKLGDLQIYQARSFNWEDFDRIYTIAWNEYWQRQKNDPRFAQAG
jgi:hypothetical protein